jgi:hypothetical protein
MLKKGLVVLVAIRIILAIIGLLLPSGVAWGQSWAPALQ